MAVDQTVWLSPSNPAQYILVFMYHKIYLSIFLVLLQVSCFVGTSVGLIGHITYLSTEGNSFLQTVYTTVIYNTIQALQCPTSSSHNSTKPKGFTYSM